MIPLVVSYFSKNTIYEKEAEGLIETCEELGVEYVIEGVEDLGSWEKNCCFKPTFIHQKLLEYKRPLLWVDCDAVILKKPSCFDSDIALTINEKLDLSDHSRILAGTIFVNYNSNSIIFLKKWSEMISSCLEKKEKQMDLVEQECLRDLVLSSKACKISSLPKGYCYIFDDPAHNLKLEEVFIVHFQASRLRFFIDDSIRNTPFFFKNVDQLKLKLLRQKIQIEPSVSLPMVEMYADLVKQKQNHQ